MVVSRARAHTTRVLDQRRRRRTCCEWRYSTAAVCGQSAAAAAVAARWRCGGGGGGGAKSYASVHVIITYMYIYMSLRTCKHWRGGVGVPHWCGGTTVEAIVMATAAAAARQGNPWRATAGAHARPSPSTGALSHCQLPRSNPRLTFGDLRKASRFFFS